jgi:acyl-CoA thioesterase FadM
MTRPPWNTTVKIRFGHCDPAGIVYFAEHFNILNGVVEDWFGDGLGLDYHHIVGRRRVGVGYGHAGADFRRPARMGERIVYAVAVERVGTKSMTLRVRAERDGEEVLTATLVIVATDMNTMAAIPIPDDIRAAVTAYREATA